MQIKEILLFSHPKSVFLVVVPWHNCTKAPDEQRCKWGPFHGDEEFKEMYDRSRKLSLPLSHASGWKCFQHVFRGYLRTRSDIWSLSRVHPQEGSSGNPLPLGSPSAWHTQHPHRRKPSCFYTWYDPRETWLWKRSLERRVNDSQRHQDFPEHSFYSMLMKPGLYAISLSKTSDTISCFGTAYTKRKSWRRGRGTEYDVFFLWIFL